MDYELQNLQYSPNIINQMKDRREKFLNFSKITMADYLINIGTSEGMTPRKKVRRCAVD